MQIGDTEIEPKPPTPLHALPAVRHQLLQTSSGNLCIAGPSGTAAGGSTSFQQHSSENTPLPQTPAPFQLQPRPTAQTPIDINALRIMQLQRSLSELSSEDRGSDAVAAAMTAELNARMRQQNGQHAQQEDVLTAGRHLDGRVIDANAAEICSDVSQEDNACDAASPKSETDTEDDTGLYAAAKQAPSELKAAFSKLMQQSSAEHRSTIRQGKTGRSSEDRTASSGRLLKCLQTKTASDVEAQAQALRPKHS